MTVRKICWIVLLLLVSRGNGLLAQNSNDILAYINTYKEISITEMQRTGIPASIILAQGIHETEAGTSELVRKSNNHFGIKCKENWTGSVVFHDDDARGECFRSYSSAIDSYKDHSDFLRSSTRYQFLFKLDPMNYAGWAYGLKKAGYATNSKYSQILIRLIRDYNLQQYTLIGMGKIRPSEEVLAGSQLLRVNLSDDSLAGQGSGDPLVIDLTPAPVYPEGVFAINNAKVVFARSGRSLLSIADQYEVPLPHLMDFNELKGEEVLVKDQLVFLQRKRKTGANEFHTVVPGETLYDISQAEGIRYESLLVLNQLTVTEAPAIGSKLSLQKIAASKPALAKLNAAPIQPEPLKNDAVAESAAPFTHIVQTKETLYSISKKYGVEVEKIQEWNKLDSMNLRTGQELIIYKN